MQVEWILVHAGILALTLLRFLRKTVGLNLVTWHMYVIRRKQSIKTHQKNENNINLSHINTNSKKKKWAQCIHFFHCLLRVRAHGIYIIIHNETQYILMQKKPNKSGILGIKEQLSSKNRSCHSFIVFSYTSDLIERCIKEP